MKNEKVDYTGVYIVKINKLEKEIERLNNIIKEVREYINSIGWNTAIGNIQDNVWKILDKVGSDKD